MQKATTEFIAIPLSKFSKLQKEKLVTLSLEESYLVLLKKLVLSSSKKKVVLLTDEGASNFQPEDNSISRMLITSYLYYTSFNFFVGDERAVLNINVVFESLNSSFIDCVDSGLGSSFLFLTRQNEEVALITQACQEKAIGFTELKSDQLALSEINDARLDFPVPKHSTLQAQYRVALGGTFDHLHIGHKILLSKAAYTARKSLICGVMDPSALTRKKFLEFLERLETRIKNVRLFLKLIRPDLAAEVVPIYDAFGPTATDPTIDTLVVSQETLAGGELVNQKRIELGYSPLEILTVEVISSILNKGLDERLLAKLSSTSIREKLSKGAMSE